MKGYYMIETENKENNQDWHLQPKENTELKPERGIPRWLFYSVVIIIAGILIVKGYIGITKPIEEKAYDAAMTRVEQEMSGTRVYFEDYNESYIRWLNDSKIIVEFPVSYTNQYGLSKTCIYSVSVEVEDGMVYPGLPARIVEDYEVTE